MSIVSVSLSGYGVSQLLFNHVLIILSAAAFKLDAALRVVVVDEPVSSK